MSRFQPTALARSFAEHAERVEKRGVTWVQKYNETTHQWIWIRSYKRADLKASIKNCNDQAYARSYR